MTYSCPYTGYARTFVFWARKYGEPYSACKPSFFQWQKGHNLLSLAVLPIGVYRLYVWSKYSKTAAAILPTEEKIHPQDDSSPRGSVVTVPVMEPSVVPQNQLNNNLNDCSETKTSSALWLFSSVDTSPCAGSCKSSVCAAGSCGTSGCGGSCGGSTNFYTITCSIANGDYINIF